jgi:two-component system sensor histidine kinase CpxA
MRSTFTKIFLSFWLTEFLILVCTIFILSNQFESEEAVYTSMFGMLISNGKLSIDAYEKGGCAALDKVPNTFPIEEQSPPAGPAILFDPNGKAVCQQVDEATYRPLYNRLMLHGWLMPERHGDTYEVGLQVKDQQGLKYAYIMRGKYPKHLYIPYREMLPRLLIGLIVSVLVTFGITMVITRPIGSLREAARQLAAGNLRARARWPRGKGGKKTGDELWGLVYDFNDMAERLETMVDAQMLLLRDVSHELRSPLARLSVALELAREEAQPGMEPQLDRIERETGRLNELIGQLLSLSHLESTTRLPDRQRLAVRDVVRELLPDVSYEAEQRGCRVNFEDDGPADFCGVVLGSPELLGRAIENVVRNAIAYTAEGTSVDIQMREENRLGDHYVVLRVRDHGPGVPEAALQSIFRPFYRLDLSRQRSTGGYGVGLAITERAIRLHGGYVKALNASDGGLVVEMRMPVDAEAVTA